MARGALDEAKKREIAVILAVGCTRRTAALFVGCHVDTIRRTAQRDAEFDARLRQAETSHEMLHLKHINSAAAEARYWRAAAWALERKYPDRYGARGPHVVTAEQISGVLAAFAAIVAEEVADEAGRKRIMERLDRLAAELETPAIKKGSHAP